jgi:abequosyltransferase
MKLSIVIPTKDRGKLLLETLETIRPQLPDGVEIVITDASTEYPNSQAAALASPQLRYQRGVASNFDAAYDEAVNAARGEWIWLFSDDDWLKPGAVDTVLRQLDARVDMVIVNAEVRDRVMERILLPRWVKFESRDYGASDFDRLFAELGDLGTFVGSLLLRRSVWVERVSQSQHHFGSRFITFIIPFLKPTPTRFIGDVLVSARFGHQGWITTTAQLIGETMVKVVWSLPIADWAKAKVRSRKPKLSELVLWRAVGSDVSKHSRLVAAMPRFVARAAIKWGLRLTGRSGGISDYMLTLADQRPTEARLGVTSPGPARSAG